MLEIGGAQLAGALGADIDPGTGRDRDAAVVRRLTRIAVGPVKLGRLKVGELRDLTSEELGALMDLAGL